MPRCPMVLLVVAVLAAGFGCADDATTSEIISNQIRNCISDLNSDSFIKRELATEKLIGIGSQAIGPISMSLDDSSLEFTTRVIHVLRELSLSGQSDTEEQARAALEKIAKVQNSSASRRAGNALARLDSIRQDRAIKHLQQLGAHISTGTVQLGMVFVPDVFTVTLNENWKGTKEDARQLKWLGDVKYLTLVGESVTNDYFQHVAEMEGLAYLIVKKANISDKALEHLKSLKNLQHLSLMYCPITDKSVEHLKAHQNVTQMKIYGTKMTKEGARQLQAAATTARIDHRHGAFLGVGCQTHAKGCEITVVHPTSAASKAGLERGDIIEAYNGKMAKDFETLTGLIAENFAGEMATLTILRGTEKLTKKITLGEWE